MRIRSSTRLFALLGDPVSHSLSPRMQNAAFNAAGIDAVYVALRCVADDVVGAMRLLAAQGGGGNVTIPHKLIAGRQGDPGSEVARLGAANTFAGSGGKLVVDNTDVDGIGSMIAGLGELPLSWAILGTGGSARAAVAAAARVGARICSISRSSERALDFTDWAAGLGVRSAELEECVVLVNATPVGLGDADPVPIDFDRLPQLAGVADFTYRSRSETALVQAATARGLAVANGLELLLMQGAAAWKIWFPAVEPPKEVMRAAIEGRMD